MKKFIKTVATITAAGLAFVILLPVANYLSENFVEKLTKKAEEL